MDGWRGMTNFGFRDETFNARNAFAPTLGAEQYRRFGFNMDGPLVKGRTSLAINVDGNANYDSQTINAETPDGNYSDVVRRPNDRMFASVRLDHQLTPTQLMRVEYRHDMNERQNLGVGDFDLQDRAYDRTTSENQLRFSLNGLLFPKVAHELKVQYTRDLSETGSFSTEPAIVVIDSFSSGGAGQQSNRRGRLLEIEDNIDFQIGKSIACGSAPCWKGCGIAATSCAMATARGPSAACPSTSLAWRPPTRSASGQPWSTTASTRLAGTSRTTTRRSRSCR